MYNKSLKVKVLEEAFNSFLDIINEYASLHDLSDADKEELVKLARDAFYDKKIKYYLEDKLSSYSPFLDFSANLALKKNGKEIDKSSWNILYVKQLKQLVTNE